MPKAEYTDTQRIDALEKWARQRGGILLHAENGPTGRLGLGIDGRSLREAIDMALRADGVVPDGVAAAPVPVRLHEGKPRDFGQAQDRYGEHLDRPSGVSGAPDQTFSHQPPMPGKDGQG